MARPKREVPSRHDDGSAIETWLDAPLDDAPREVARQLALNLRGAMGKRSTRGVRAATGVDHTTVADILNGTTWPDLNTLAKLEHGLGVDLWPAGVARQHLVEPDES